MRVFRLRSAAAWLLAAGLLLTGGCAAKPASRAPATHSKPTAGGGGLPTRPATTAGGGAPTKPAALHIARTSALTLRRTPAPTSAAPAPGIQDAFFLDARHGVLVTGGIKIGTPNGTALSGTGRIQLTADGGTTWTTVWRNPSADLSWIGFADRRHGFAAGTTFPARNAAGDPLLLATSDGGHTWRAIRPTLPAGAAAAWWGLRFEFVSARIGYAITDPDFSMGPGGLSGVLRTTDGGHTWTLAHLPGGTATGGLAFPSPRVGFATGSSKACFGGIWTTTDGGGSWHLLPSTCSHTYRLHALDFLNARTGFAAGGRNDKWSNPPWQVLVETRDGGRSWRTVYTDRARPDPFGGAMTRLHFADASHGWAVTGGCVMGQNTPCAGQVLTTADGGRTWKAAGRTATHLATAGPGHAWAIPPAPGGSGLLWRTSDGGATWLPIGRPQASGFSLVDAGGSTVLAGGAAGLLLSRDGGHTWRRLNVPGLAAAPADAAAGSGLLVLAGPGGSQLRVSRDGGVDWSPVDVPGTRGTGLSAFALRPTGQGLAATRGSMCLKDGRQQPSRLLGTNDGGRRWHVLPPPPFAVDHLALGPHLAVALGQGGCHPVVGLSRDGGHTWRTWRLPKGLSCGSVATAPIGDVWIGCSSLGADFTRTAALLVGRGGGVRWSELSAPKFSIDSLAGVSATGGWMAGDGALWHTADGGRTWSEVWPTPAEP